MKANTQAAVSGCSKEEGDYIARMVLQLVRAIVEDPTVGTTTEPEPVHTSPVYRAYEQLVDGPRAS